MPEIKSSAPQLPAELSAEEMIAALPDIKVADARSPDGRRMRRTIKKGLAHLILREIATSMRRGHRGRNSTDIVNHYDVNYQTGARNAAASYDKPARYDLFRFGNRFIAEADGRQFLRSMTERLGDIIETLEPKELCEVGSGSGRNLMYLAARFPTLPCTGYELTAGGVAIAKAFQGIDELPETGYGRFYRLNRSGMDNLRRIDFVQASAFDLPAADQSLDVVYTFAALEQMQLGIDDALAELRRVARRYVLLFEPFADFNDGLGRAYLWARNYFRMNLDELPAHGFEVVRTWRSVPVKPTFAYGFVLLKRR